ncbi:PocR ligand-binding domain-containing protein [Desulforhopalus vacuolatus]|uniref:PocR ligand-binding domain-containing protein n=1 Tax=Desulforhopalus vacuolatus TaxID=40414 RepID=UPI001963D8EB|nr:PocR ligand-binding domain-containing protein [Desulforhopalus vacuolatus]MBM9518594.1 PocR ligand-binding domain-containing protein [Desulforhopalus vacuolatus]
MDNGVLNVAVSREVLNKLRIGPLVSKVKPHPWRTCKDGQVRQGLLSLHSRRLPPTPFFGLMVSGAHSRKKSLLPVSTFFSQQTMLFITMKVYLRKQLFTGTLLLLIIFHSSSILPAPVFAEELPEHQTILKSASELDYPPFAIVKPDGTAAGFSVDLLTAAIEAVGLSVSFKVDSWNIIKQELIDKKIDVLPLMSYSRERDKVYDFTAPYLRMNGTVFIRKGNTEIQHITDLQDKEVLVMEGDTAHEYVVTHKLSKNIIPTVSYEDAFTLLASGKHDAVVVQQIVGLQMIKKLGIENVVPVEQKVVASLKPMTLKLEGFEQKFCFAVPEGRQEVLTLLNEGLAIIYLDGTYNTLYDKWFGPILPTPTVSLSTLIKQTLLILVPLFLVFTLVGLWYLKRLVNKRTNHLELEIKQRKKIERELAEANTKYVKAQEIGKVGNWEYNNNTEEFWASTEARRICGFDMDSETLTTEAVESCIPERERVHQALVDLIERNVPYNLEFDIITRDTHQRRTLVSIAELERDSAANPIRTRGVIQDISARRKVEKALLESEERLRLLFDNSPVGICTVDLLGNFISTNPAYEKMLGYSSEELKELSFFDVTHPDYRPKNKELFQNMFSLNSTGFKMEKIYVRKDGGVINVSVNATAVIDGKGNTRFGTAFVDDITEKKQVEEALLQSEATIRNKLKAITEPEGDIGTLELSDIIDTEILQSMMEDFYQLTGMLGAVLDVSGKILVAVGWQDICTKFHRCNPDSLMNCLASDTILTQGVSEGTFKSYKCKNNMWDIVTPIMVGGRHVGNVFMGQYLLEDEEPDVEFFQEQARKYGFNTEDYLAALERVPRFSKETVDAGMQFYSKLAKIISTLSFNSIQQSRMLTERKQAEEEKLNLENRLQQSQKMESIGTLAGGIAHDFNNLLSVILGFTEMAKDDCQPGSSISKDLDEVLGAGNRAKSLVQQILAFSRQDDMERMILQPASIVKETITMLRPSLPTTIEIAQDIDAVTGLVFVDPSKLNQILMNLCTNAFHAMEETGGKLDISLKEVTLTNEDLIHEPDVTAGTFIQLSIGDSGTGIAPTVKNKIFDPYFTTKEIGKGTGMGLSVVHGIVKNYGGFISLYSELDEGSVFHVFLPIVEKEALTENEINDQIPIGRERILFIDDEEILTKMSKTMLEKLGYHVTVINNSLEALENFQNQPDKFDIVITDQTMPGMTGSDLSMRMLQVRPDIPIILCTGYSTIISEGKAKSMGIKEFAFKPLAKKDIAKLIRKVLDVS